MNPLLILAFVGAAGEFHVLLQALPPSRNTSFSTLLPLLFTCALMFSLPCPAPLYPIPGLSLSLTSLTFWMTHSQLHHPFISGF